MRCQVVRLRRRPIDVDQERGILTALIRDQENAKEHWPNELRQWNLATGELRWQASVGGAGDLAVCHAKDLLVVVQGQEIQLRKLSTGETIKTWASENHLGEVAVSEDGTRLAHGYTQWSSPAGSAPTAGGIEIWNIATGKLEQHIQGLDRVDSVEFSPLGELLLVCSSSGTSRLYNSSTGGLVSVWDTIDGQLLPSPKPLPAGVHRVRFTNSREVAIGCENATLRLQPIGN